MNSTTSKNSVKSIPACRERASAGFQTGLFLRVQPLGRRRPAEAQFSLADSNPYISLSHSHLKQVKLLTSPGVMRTAKNMGKTTNAIE